MKCNVCDGIGYIDRDATCRTCRGTGQLADPVVQEYGPQKPPVRRFRVTCRQAGASCADVAKLSGIPQLGDPWNGGRCAQVSVTRDHDQDGVYYIEASYRPDDVTSDVNPSDAHSRHDNRTP